MVSIDAIKSAIVDREEDMKNRLRMESEEKAGEELGCKNKTVITWDYEEEGEIRFMPLWRWLLS